MSKVNKAIILVAGYEKKLSPFTDNMHQCMFKVGEYTVLEKLLKNLSACGIKKAVLVVGHCADVIKNKINSNYSGIEIKYVENKDYAKTNTLYSLYLSREEMNEPFLLIDGDMITESDFIQSIIDDENENVMALDFSAQDKNPIVIAKVLNNRITQIGKNIPKLDDENFARFLGISKYGREFANKFQTQLVIYAESDKLDSLYEDAINELLETEDVRVFNSRKYNWFEIDTITEFEKAKKIYGDTENLKQKAYDFGADEAYIMLPTELIFDDRAILQCFNCKNFGVKKTCPPFVMKVDYEGMFKKYKKGLFVLVKFDSSLDFAKARLESTNKLHKILLKLEKEAFTQDNHFTISFIGGSCKLCPQGCAEGSCRNPGMSRIPLESTGVDVVETLKKFGVELKFPATDCIYRVGLLLIG